jgi:hypothetical protein
VQLGLRARTEDRPAHQGGKGGGGGQVRQRGREGDGGVHHHELCMQPRHAHNSHLAWQQAATVRSHSVTRQRRAGNRRQVVARTRTLGIACKKASGITVVASSSQVPVRARFFVLDSSWRVSTTQARQCGGRSTKGGSSTKTTWHRHWERLIPNLNLQDPPSRAAMVRVHACSCPMTTPRCGLRSYR